MTVYTRPDGVWLAVGGGPEVPIRPAAIQELIAALIRARRDAHGLPSGSSWWAPRL